MCNFWFVSWDNRNILIPSSNLFCNSTSYLLFFVLFLDILSIWLIIKCTHALRTVNHFPFFAFFDTDTLTDRKSCILHLPIMPETIPSGLRKRIRENFQNKAHCMTLREHFVHDIRLDYYKAEKSLAVYNSCEANRFPKYMFCHQRRYTTLSSEEGRNSIFET